HRKKKEAMLLKEQYLIAPNKSNKKSYLTLFDESNKWLSKNYSNLMIDSHSKKLLLKKDKYTNIKTSRISNAEYLHKGLVHNVNIKTMFKMSQIDCPLFVPIIVTNGKRDYLRKKLIDNKIYCPVHWPQP